MGAHALSQNLAAGWLFFTSSVVAALILYVWSGPRRRDLALTGAAAVALSVVLGLPGVAYAKPMALLAYWAVTAFVYSFVAAILSKAHLRRVPTLLAMMVPPLCTIGTLPALVLMSTLTPSTLDYYLYAFDGSYGFQPGFLAARVADGTGWLRVLTEACYINVPAAMTVLYCLERSRSSARANRFLLLIMALAVSAFASYYLFPGVGSIVLFGPRFPDSPPALSDVAVRQLHALDYPRNCMPSLHTAWVLAAWWRSMRFKPIIQALFAAYAFFTLLYTLSSGHYFVDMVVAVPFTVLIYGLTFSTAGRKPGELACSSAMFAGWLVFLRFGESIYRLSPAIPWGISALTCVVSAIILVRINARERAPEELPEPGMPAPISVLSMQ